MKQNKVIGLTGGSGSGKSLAAKIFEQNGALVIDADKISHEITDSDEKVLGKIREIFSETVFENGKLSRKALGRIVFNDKDALENLNKILHPVILKRIKDIADNTDKDIIVIDAPLLFAVKELVDMCDEIVAVCAPDEMRINRIILRDGLTHEEAKRRISSQMTQEEIAEKSDVVIVNDGEPEEFRREIIGYISK